MKQTAKIVSILLVIILLFSGCSVDFDGIISLISGKSVFEIEDGLLGDVIIDAKIVDDTVITLMSKYIDDEKTDYYLCKLNAKNAKPVASKKLESCPIDYPYGLDIDENGNIVIYGTLEGDGEEDIVEEYSVCFSADTLTQNSEREEHNPSLPSVEIEQAPMGLYMNWGETVAGNEYTDIPNQPIRFFYLRSDLDTVILANDLNFSIISSFGNLAAGFSRLDIENEDQIQSILVYDFENSVLVNKLDVETPEEEDLTSNIISVYLNEKYILYSVETGNYDTDEFVTKYYIWRYRVKPLNEPFESEKLTVKQLEESNKKLCEQIKESTGINIYINSDKYDFYGEDEDYYLYKNAKPLEVNILLTRIKAFLDYLPEGFAKEMYTDLDIFKYGGFDIYIGDSIKGTASAYASSFMDNLTIVFSTGASDFRTVAHEFMHIMDTRIEDKLGVDVSFYDLWIKHNPDGFNYEGLNNDNPSYDYEDYEDWFISSYAMSTDAEDRAEIFSYLFVDSFSDEIPPEWYTDNKPLKEKTDYLIKMIREAYPSLKNVKTAQWEKAVKEN